MDIAIVTAGSHGDVHPYLAVGRELAARGHSVRFWVHPHFHDDVRHAGLAPVPLAPELDIEGALRHPDLMHRRRGGRFVMDLLFKGAETTFHDLGAAFRERRPDVVLSHHICFGVRWLCAREGIPCALGVLSPLLWLSRHGPVPCMQHTPGWFGATLAYSLRPFAVLLVKAMINPGINRLRRSFGLPRDPHPLLSEFRGGDLNLALWSPHFRGPRADDPERGIICGFPWYDRAHPGHTLEPDLEAFLGDGPPPIVFCLGTAASYSPGDFHEQAARAAQSLGRRAILLVGRGLPAPGALPPGVIAKGYAPFSLLLPRAAITVHHGGIGSTAQALRSGRPALVIPHAHDQFNNAVLAHHLGVAGMLPRHRVTERRLTRALDHLLNDERASAAAVRLGPQVGSDDGARVAAERLEALASEAPRP